MNSQGNWVNIYSFSSNLENIDLLLEDTSLETGVLQIKDDNENLVYHHFKVISESSSGMLSTEENVITIPNEQNVSSEQGLGSMIIGNTNIIR
jgi:hypothetical protein